MCAAEFELQAAYRSHITYENSVCSRQHVDDVESSARGSCTLSMNTLFTGSVKAAASIMETLRLVERLRQDEEQFTGCTRQHAPLLLLEKMFARTVIEKCSRTNGKPQLSVLAAQGVQDHAKQPLEPKLSKTNPWKFSNTYHAERGLRGTHPL